MLIGREAECRRLEDLLARALRRTSATLVIRGEAGMGKTALLGFARDRADGFKISSAAGVESEADLPFAALVGLSRPLLGYLDRTPNAQRFALEAALGMSAGPVLDRFTVYAGLLSLLAAAAEDQPRLLLVDDLQWLDMPSAEALLFVARRLGPDRVAIVATTRAGEDEHLDLRGLEEIQLAGLERMAALELLRRHGGSLLSDDVASRLVDLTGGAPLALVEIPTLLTPGQLTGVEPLPDPLPASDAVQRAFRRRIDALPAATAQALFVLAADETGSLEHVAHALRVRGLTTDVLEPAVRAGLIRLAGGDAQFRHPLLRSAVYQRAAPLERRAAHRALADACEPGPNDARAWHLAAAALEPDEETASALEESATAARARGGYASAARALERAAELTPDLERRARRLLVAGESAWLGGQADRAIRSLDAAVSLTADPLVRADIQLLRARVLFVNGSVTDSYSVLVDEASRIAAVAPEKAVTMLTEACSACWAAAELDRGLDAAEWSTRIAARIGGDAELAAALALAQALILRGRTREGRQLFDTWKGAFEEHRRALVALPFGPTIAAIYYMIEDYSFARSLLGTLYTAARGTAAPQLLPLVLGYLTDLEFRTGDWASAYAHATEGAQLAAAIGQGPTRAFVLAQLARVEAGMGREDARMHAREVRQLIARTGARSLWTYSHAALGLLDLRPGRLEAAIVELEEVDRLMREWHVGDPNVLQWMPDLIEAYIRTGRRAKAEALLDTLQAQAERTDGNWARATAARCAGMLAEVFDEDFLRALDLHRRTPTPFERARTELCFGERLRRAGRRTEARAHLRPALEAFDWLGASPWRDRAAAELGVSVEHVTSRENRIDRLSPQELQVALLVAEGATNREAAAALFVTTKTVEFHLRNVYRKLGIRSRTQLARAVAAGLPGSEHRNGRGP